MSASTGSPVRTVPHAESLRVDHGVPVHHRNRGTRHTSLVHRTAHNLVDPGDGLGNLPGRNLPRIGGRGRRLHLGRDRRLRGAVGDGQAPGWAEQADCQNNQNARVNQWEHENSEALGGVWRLAISRGEAEE